jgi:exodeoxyribonuclease V alpha subunit
VGVEVDILYRPAPEELSEESVRRPILHIPERFKHVDLARLVRAKGESGVEELKVILRSVHPWSSLHYGLTALETVLRLYTKTIPIGWGSARRFKRL